MIDNLTDISADIAMLRGRNDIVAWVVGMTPRPTPCQAVRRANM